MRVERLDHLVLTVRDIETTCDFYQRALGMEVRRFGTDNERVALHYGSQKINLHLAGQEVEPKAASPMPGSADLCFITQTPVEDVLAHLRAEGVAVVLGAVERTGATGKLISVYVRDPDGNLLEISQPV